MINQLNDVFGGDGDLLVVSYGQIHEYLEMIIDRLVDGRVIFTIYDYLEDILAETPYDFDGNDITPAVSF